MEWGCQVNIAKGQVVYSGRQMGRVIRKMGPHAVAVLTERDKLIMAGTFPDRPIGTQRRLVKEVWPLRCVSLEAPANKDGGAL